MITVYTHTHTHTHTHTLAYIAIFHCSSYPASHALGAIACMSFSYSLTALHGPTLTKSCTVHTQLPVVEALTLSHIYTYTLLAHVGSFFHHFLVGCNAEISGFSLFFGNCQPFGVVSATTGTTYSTGTVCGNVNKETADYICDYLNMGNATNFGTAGSKG